ncbi:MAG: hypothetical protein QM756_42485 [Polyangiaceae bacterium]
MVFACSSNDDSKPNSSAGGVGTQGGVATQGGANASGGSAAGGAAAGGAAAGGAAAGGIANGGAVSGGSASGGASAGAAGSSSVKPCAPPADKDQPHELLSQTGCFDSARPTQFSSVVLPYEVMSPLWSDSADKARGMVLPPGGKIRVLDCATTPTECSQGTADSGRWIFPVGTVMIKNFSFDGKLVETRLFERFDETTWVGYSYAWNEAQSDATVVPTARTSTTFNTGQRSIEWTFPARRECLKCHTVPGGSTLGPETAQMNRVVDGVNQIDHLSSLGLFEKAPAKPYQAPLVTPYASQAGTPPASATVEQRARSYLHANCAFCHRPDGEGPSFDARFGVAFADTHMCNTPPDKGDLGVIGSSIVTPSKPDMSVLWLRIKAAGGDVARMPPIASVHPDVDGVKVVGDWISSLTSCP